MPKITPPRDGNLMKDIPDWSVFTHYTSPIESKHRYRISAIEKPVAISGSLTNQIRPGDWVFGDMDGVVIIPQGLVNDVLAKAEEVGEIEDAARIDIRDGIDVKAVFDKYGRL